MPSRRGAVRREGRRPALPLTDLPPEVLLMDLRRIGSKLRGEAREVLRQYLGGLSRMGLDTVESATYLSCAFLNAMLEEAPAVRAELTQQLERFIGGQTPPAAERAPGRGRPSVSRRTGRRGSAGGAADEPARGRGWNSRRAR